jgi:predicted acylesterase/phospholipase RssA
LRAPSPSDPVPGGYDALVLGGGGCRCFWQAGFWTEAAPALGLAPRVVAGVSAGAAFACAIAAGVLGRVLEDFSHRVAANERNAYPVNALKGRPVFPHERIYRGTILAALDQEAYERLQAGPEVRISVARPPAWSGRRSGYAVGLLAYLAERQLDDGVHTSWGRRLGFRNEVVSARSCRSREELADLILQSSCVPPITPAYRRAGRPVLDGGIYDPVPIEAVDGAQHSLVLLSWRHREDVLPRVPGRTYVQPSEPIRIHKWDYTSPELVRRTYDLGRADGERFVRRFAESEPDGALRDGGPIVGPLVECQPA